MIPVHAMSLESRSGHEQPPIDAQMSVILLRCGTAIWGGGRYCKRVKLYRCGISKCFRPKRRASIDHAPGPIIASVRPNAASIMEMPAPSTQENAIHDSTTAINAPQTGVHKPSSSNAPALAPMRCGTDEDVPPICQKLKPNRNAAVTTRCSRRPMPGQPFGNTEKRRCKSHLFPS